MALSSRELEIVELATHGHTDKEIAQELGIRFTSVKSHWARIRRKCNASNRAQVIGMHVVRGPLPVERPSPEQTSEFHRLRAYWTTLLSQIPLFVTVLDEQGRFQWCGHRDHPELVESLVGRYFPDAVAPDDRQIVEDAFNLAFLQGRTSEFGATLPVGKTVLSVTGFAHPVTEGGRTIGVLTVGTLRQAPDPVSMSTQA